MSLIGDGSSIKPGCGIARLEVLLDKVESLQTTPEKLGRSELADRSSGEGGEFAECPWLESLPPRAASSEAERSWRGRVAEDFKKSRADSLALVHWTPEDCLYRASAECGRAVGGPARAGSLQTVPAAARSGAALRLSGGGPGRDVAQVAPPQAGGATTPRPAVPRALWAGLREVIPAAVAPAQQEDIINGAQEKCVLPLMDGYPHYEGKIKWMKDMWRSDPCYADYGVDGSTCSFFIYLSENRKIYLDIIHTYMEVHAIVYGSSTKNIPSYVTNHGILSGRDLQFLLRETKLFVGLGFPYEGPAPLKAIANGCAFLNPKFNPPKSSKNTDFFISKPTLRELTSQHLYAEVFIGRPHVWTVNLNNQEEVEDAVKAILNQKIEPYMPYKFTCEGILQRINAFIKKQDFCHGQVMWPPLSALQVKPSEPGQSCKQVFQENQLICEQSFFQHLNKDKDLLKYEVI
ncbi:alpha-1,6-mannosylglycoprotein 6-beta-N-acetylglucosaminyltransferase A-like [Callospermophilus lateralis]|uniref:alpha-1,6-mannosylglycoprotein 6-beta-N-acetylglucosaminyltransferase A-like n=1 Tax=Callospermophilus lateralis TaxID=76772 RepID=UPI00405389D7